MTRIAVVGAGSWGTAVAAIAAGNVATTIWARRPELAAQIRDRHESPTYLPDVVLPDALHATDSLEEACSGADVVVLGVPSHGLRSVLADARPFIEDRVPVVSLAKGIEQTTLSRMTEVACEVLAGHEPACVGVLTGPNLARGGRRGPTDGVGRRDDRRRGRRRDATDLLRADVAGVHQPRRRRL